ncbi:MAG TPA: O-antigen ligase family protein, partial [Geminicoccaceae bacterium]|nr:O-antigen ligase family protein [Geminicoccaceae bacterium]
MTAFLRTSHVSPLSRLLTIRARHFDLGALELPLTRLAIFFSVFPMLRPGELFFTYSDILFCLSGVLLLLSGRLRFAPMGPLTGPWLMSFAVLSLALIISSLLGPAPERALIVVGQYAFAYILLAYIVVRDDQAIVDSFIRAFVLGTVCVNAYGLVIYFTGGDDTFRLVTGSGRLTSFMGNPNANANVIGLTLPLLFYLWFSRRWRLPYVLVSVAILAYALVATSSVGGLLWSLAGVGVFIVLAIRWRLLVGIAVVVAVALPLLEVYGPLILPETFQVRVLQALEAGDLQHAGTFSSRMGLIHEALEVVDERLLFGMGVDQYRAESEMGAPVHDIYLLLWAEGGLPALIGWLMLPQIIILAAVRMLGRPRGRLIAATTLAVVTVFLLAATGSAHMYARFWVVPLHLCVALLVT